MARLTCAMIPPLLQTPDMHNWLNIRIAGKVKLIPENNTMWAVLTTSSFTPVLEFDFIGPLDAYELLGLSDPEKFNTMSPGEQHVGRTDNTISDWAACWED